MDSEPKKKKKGKGKKKHKKNKVGEASNSKNFFQQNAPSPGQKWEDDLFPPNDKSLIGSTPNSNDSFECTNKDIDPTEIEWKRANEIFPEPHLFEGEISTKKIVNGKIGNPYFLSAICAIAEYPGLISNIFLTKEYNPDGFYTLKLFIDGEYQIIYIDDYFPCLKGTNIPYFLKPNNFELWPMLLEKAWAKVNGSYANSISGWPIDVFRAFTGFACEDINHNEEPKEKIWEKIKEVKDNNGIICTSTRNGDEINEKGLISGYTYSIVFYKEVENDRHVKICLLKLRNDLGGANWNGDWSEESVYWNDHIRKQITPENMELKEGEFYICLEDFVNYFSRTDLCHLIFNGFTKTFEFSLSDIVYPHVYNFFLHEKADVSISVIEKNWRFHRELRNISHPTSIILGKYEPESKKIKDITCVYESYDYAEKKKLLDSGFYFIWVYKGMNQSQEPLPESLKIRIISGGEISIKYIGNDSSFDIIEQIICEGVKNIKDDKITNSEIFYDISSDFEKSGIGYRLIINPLKNVSQKWEIDASQNKGYYLLSEFENKQAFNFVVNPNDFECVLFLRDKKYGKFKLNITNEVEQNECEESQKREKKRKEFDSFCLGDLRDEEKLKSEKTPSLEELSKKEKYPEYDDNRIFFEKNTITGKENILNYDEIMKLEPQEDKVRLGFVKLENEDGIYVGEADYATPQGRGYYVFKNDDQSWLGYFENGEKGKYGKFYDKDGKLIYEGEYKHGEKSGKGTYYYPNGMKYEGEFVKNKKEGKGIFHWDNKTRWEGTFVDDKMDGTGTYYDGEDSSSKTYEKGKIVE